MVLITLTLQVRVLLTPLSTRILLLLRIRWYELATLTIPLACAPAPPCLVFLEAALGAAGTESATLGVSETQYLATVDEASPVGPAKRGGANLPLLPTYPSALLVPRFDTTESYSCLFAGRLESWYNLSTKKFEFRKQAVGPRKARQQTAVSLAT